MQLAPMRYSKFEGTSVAVSVNSAVEAKAALKELRHKKREINFLRAALRRRLKAIPPPPSGRRKSQPSLMRRTLRGIGWLIRSLIEVATVSKAQRRAMNPAEIARELAGIDELLHNIDGCILQLEGKLLARG
jgi:hypothetical protein